MTDQEIIQGLIDRDECIIRDFFFERCKPLFYGIIRTVFDNKAEYDELVDELYLYLMEGNAAKLKNFQFRCSVFQWLKVLSIHFFIRLRNQGNMIDNESHESLNKDDNIAIKNDACNTAKDDLKRLLEALPNERYAFVIQRLVMDDVQPEELAREMNITPANLYNIKKRAIRQLTQIALNDIHYYGEQQ